MKKISVIGGTGYTGFELLRLLLRHPNVNLVETTSRTYAGTEISKMHPALEGFLDKEYITELSHPDENDLVFVAAPHGASMEVVPPLIDAGCRVIDLSGDYRLGEVNEYQKWYGKEHTDSKNLSKAIYGLPELNREAIANAQLVANPGCYPTGALLALIPAMKSNAIEGDLIIDSKSGTSGAGISPSMFTHHSSCAASISPYKVGKHRHTPEIEKTLRSLGPGIGEVSFTPHLVPLVRGIETSCYFRISEKSSFDMLKEDYGAFSEKNVFVKFVEELPKISSVLGSNYCHISMAMTSENIVAIFSVIDNLCKGGSGQAIQNMNVMFGLDEKMGLDFPGLGV